MRIHPSTAILLGCALLVLPARAESDTRRPLAAEFLPRIGETELVIGVADTHVDNPIAALVHIGAKEQVAGGAGAVVGSTAAVGASILALPAVFGSMLGMASVAEIYRRVEAEAQPFGPAYLHGAEGFDFKALLVSKLHERIAGLGWLPLREGERITAFDQDHYTESLADSSARSVLIVHAGIRFSHDLELLGAAAKVALFHRELGPANISIRRDGRVAPAKWNDEPIYRAVVAVVRTPTPLARPKLQVYIDQRVAEVNAEFAAKREGESSHLVLERLQTERIRALGEVDSRRWEPVEVAHYMAPRWAAEDGKVYRAQLESAVDGLVDAIVTDLAQLEPAGNHKKLVVRRL